MIKTREQIQSYLMLDENSALSPEEFELIINTAEQIEQKYEKELAEYSVGYGLLCDYESNPTLLEDDHKMEKIEEMNGIVIYKRIPLDELAYEDNERKLVLEIDIKQARLALVGDGYTLEEANELTEEKILKVWKSRFEKEIINGYYKGKRIGLYE